jgi:hypothetical protein
MNEDKLNSNSEHNKDYENPSAKEFETQNTDLSSIQNSIKQLQHLREQQLITEEDFLERLEKYQHLLDDDIQSYQQATTYNSQPHNSVPRLSKQVMVIAAAVSVIAIIAIVFFAFGGDPFSDANLREAGFVQRSENIWTLQTTSYGDIRECIYRRGVSDSKDSEIIAKALNLPNSPNQSIVTCSAGNTGNIMYFHDFNAHAVVILSYSEYFNYVLSGFSASRAQDLASYSYLYHYEDGFVFNVSAPSDVTSDYFNLTFSFHDLMNDKFNLGLK